MKKKEDWCKFVISMLLLGAIFALPGCGMGKEPSDKIKAVVINQEEEAKRSALSIDKYADKYPKATELLEDEKYFEAMVILRNLANYQDGRKLYNIALRKQSRISTGDEHVLGLKSDGTVIARGFKNLYGECNVDGVAGFETIIQDKDGVYGTKRDGSREFLGLEESYDYNDYANKPKWGNIVAVSAGDAFSAGVKSDGTVVSTSFETQDWNDIVAITEVNHEGWMHCIGLKRDGTLVYTGDSTGIKILSELGLESWDLW